MDQVPAINTAWDPVAQQKLACWAPKGLHTPARGLVLPEYGLQAPLQPPAATGLPRQRVWQANTYCRSAELLVRTQSQRSDGAVVLISSISCSVNLKTHTSGCPLVLLLAAHTHDRSDLARVSTGGTVHQGGLI